MTDTTQLDRRTFTRLAGAAGAAALAGCSSPGNSNEQTASDPETDTTTAEPQTETDYEFFDTEQAAAIQTLVDRLLPSDEDRPAASDVGVIRYIDRALRREPFYDTAHDDRRFQDAYDSGLSKLDETANEMFGKPVRELSPSQADELLSKTLDRSAPGWEDVPTTNSVSMTVPAEAFVSLLRDHAVEGYYAQPKYGGNADLTGWKQSGYTGPFIEGYTPEELKPPWKSFEEHEQEKNRPSDLYGEFGGDGDA